MATGETTALTMRTFVGKVMSLLFNMLTRFVIAFLPRSKYLLISWLQSPFTVILEPKKIKSVTVSIFSPSICHDGPLEGPRAILGPQHRPALVRRGLALGQHPAGKQRGLAAHTHSSPQCTRLAALPPPGPPTRQEQRSRQPARVGVNSLQ